MHTRHNDCPFFVYSSVGKMVAAKHILFGKMQKSKDGCLAGSGN